jgi:putative spermidine/putrescine transport system permease protein
MSTASMPGALETAVGEAPAPTSSPVRRRRLGRVGDRVVLLIAAIYFFGPLLAAIAYTLRDRHGGITFEAYREIFRPPRGAQVGLGGSLAYSLEIAIVAILITLLLMVPTQLLLHLRLPRWKGLVEVLTLLPLVFPPIVLVVGVSAVYGAVAPETTTSDTSVLFEVLRFLREDSHPFLLALLYVMLAMPFVYRAIEAGITSIDTRTLVEAARNLGAGWGTVLFRVIAPSLRTAIVNASFLCFALVMGEYTISSILLYTKPFPVWLVQLPTQSGQVQAAVSVFSLLLVEVVLLLIGLLNRRPHTRSS